MQVEYPASNPGSWRRLFGVQRTRQPIPGAPSASCNGHHHSGSGTHGQDRRHTTTEVVPRVESDHKDPSGYPKLPKAADWRRVPTGLPSGARCPYPRRESRVLKPHELLHKGSGIKAVFSLAPLPRGPCMGESPCSLGGGVASSNHQFPGQTDRGQDTEGRPPTASASASR